MRPGPLLQRMGHAFRDPSDFLQRVLTAAEIWWDERGRPEAELGRALPWSQVRHELDAAGWQPPEAFLRELETRVDGIRRAPAFRLTHDADRELAECCYALCRQRRPERVVETGVAYGITSAYLLEALRENGSGHLHSVDFPPYGAGAREAVGRAVPERLRSRWTLHRGRARRVLPRLLPRLGAIDLFLHDSLHTAYNIRRELEIVRPWLAPGAAVVADDIEGSTAFEEFATAHLRRWWLVRERSKEAAFGVGWLAR